MKKALLGVGLAAVIGIGYSTFGGGGGDAADPGAAGDKLVLDRLWIDHIPTHDRDIVQVFVAITEQPFGIFQATSQWKGEFELFQYEAHGNELRIVYGQTGERDKVKAAARKCGDKGFDFCLELKGNSRGVKKYYSMEGWEVGGASPDELRARVEALVDGE